MLSSNCHCDNFNLFLGFVDDVGYFGAHHRFGEGEFLALERLDQCGDLTKCVRRLTAKLDLIIVILKIIMKL